MIALSAMDKCLRQILAAVAPEGTLQGIGETAVRFRGSIVASTEYYIEDVPTRLPADGPALKSRLRACSLPDGHKLRVARHSSFNWVDDEIRLRCVHFFKLQPLKALLRSEGVLSYEDVMSASPTPLWGQIDFFRTDVQLDRAYDASRKQCANDVAKRLARCAAAAARRRALMPAFLPPLPVPSEPRTRDRK